LQPECLYIALNDSGHPFDKLSVRQVRNTGIHLYIDYDNDVLEAQNAFANLMMTFGVGEQLKSFRLVLKYRGNGFEAWLELLQRCRDALGTEIRLDVALDAYVPNAKERLLTIRDTLNRYCVGHILDEDRSDSYQATFTLFMKDEQ